MKQLGITSTQSTCKTFSCHVSSRPQSDTLTNKIASNYGVCMQSVRPQKSLRQRIFVYLVEFNEKSQNLLN